MTTVVLIAIGIAAVLFMGRFFVGLYGDSKVDVPCCLISLSQRGKISALDCGNHERHVVVNNRRDAAYVDSPAATS